MKLTLVCFQFCCSCSFTDVRTICCLQLYLHTQTPHISFVGISFLVCIEFVCICLHFQKLYKRYKLEDTSMHTNVYANVYPVSVLFTRIAIWYLILYVQTLLLYVICLAFAPMYFLTVEDTRVEL